MSLALSCSRRQAVVTLVGAAVAVACGRAPKDQPATIAYGRDECAWCRMPVDDPRLAAQWVSPDRDAVSFGEPGCLLSWLAAHPGINGAAWLRPRDGDQWRRAGEVTIARGVITTPMAFNLTAYLAPPPNVAAESLFTWSQLLQKGAPDARPS